MLDFDKVRAYYFDPPLPDPERIPSREEVYALHERRRFESCVRRGGDPEAEGIGPHGSLIGGPGKPLTVLYGPPEQSAELHPLPLAWFDHPRGRNAMVPPGGMTEAEAFFESLSRAHLAGHRDRPSGPLLRRHFGSPELSDLARSHVWHVFAAMRSFDLHRLLPRSAVSLFEIARALHLTGTTRAVVVAWINQFGHRPGR